MKKRKYLIVVITIIVIITIFQQIQWEGTRKNIVNKPQPVYAQEEWDFFVVDKLENYYIEDHEKNLIQKFNKKGNFIKGYYMAEPIMGIKLVKDKVHLLTKSEEEYILLDNKIKYIGKSKEEDISWQSYFNTDIYEKYFINYNKVTKRLDSDTYIKIKLNTPIFPMLVRWHYYTIGILLGMLVISFFKSKEKTIVVDFIQDIEYLWEGRPDKSIHLSLRKVINIIWGLPGVFIIILGFMSVLNSNFLLALGMFSVGIPFFWLGIGNLFLIEYIKIRSDYFITDKEIIIVKHYKLNYIYKVPLSDIKQIDIFDKSRQTASLKLWTKNLECYNLAHKNEEDIMYDLKEVETVINLIQKNVEHTIKVIDNI